VPMVRRVVLDSSLLNLSRAYRIYKLRYGYVTAQRPRDCGKAIMKSTLLAHDGALLKREPCIGERIVLQ
jgi:hypothetical protein